MGTGYSFDTGEAEKFPERTKELGWRASLALDFRGKFENSAKNLRAVAVSNEGSEVSLMAREVALVWSPSRAAMQRGVRRRSLLYSYLNIWPFVGVLFALLFLFIANVPPFHSIACDLPGSFYATVQPNARAEDSMKVYVTRDGRVYFRDNSAEPKSLLFLIRNAMQEGAERKVYLSVDSRAMYRDASAVVNEIGNAGITKICILANKREK